MSPKRHALAVAFVSASVSGFSFVTCRAANAQSSPPVAVTPPVASAPAAPALAAPPAASVTPATSTPPAAAPAPAATPAAAAPTPPVTAPAVSTAPSATAPPAPAARTVTSPGQAWVHIAVNHRDAWLEMRSYVDGGEFIRTCRTPCDAVLQVEGREARVVAPGMTTSNVFRVAAGGGTAGVRVDGGSASARRAGIITLLIGIPVALAGMGLFAQGRLRNSTGLQAAGIGGLAGGGLSLGISLPLLLLGTTRVRDASGSLIASNEPVSRL